MASKRINLVTGGSIHADWSEKSKRWDIRNDNYEHLWVYVKFSRTVNKYLVAVNSSDTVDTVDSVEEAFICAYDRILELTSCENMLDFKEMQLSFFSQDQWNRLFELRRCSVNTDCSV